MSRDTQFAHFAALLIPELDEQFGAVADWAEKHDIDDEKKIAMEMASRYLTVISRRAYDLVRHAVSETIGSTDISHVPDMRQWPEETSK